MVQEKGKTKPKEMISVQKRGTGSEPEAAATAAAAAAAAVQAAVRGVGHGSCILFPG